MNKLVQGPVISQKTIVWPVCRLLIVHSLYGGLTWAVMDVTSRNRKNRIIREYTMLQIVKQIKLSAIKDVVVVFKDDTKTRANLACGCLFSNFTVMSMLNC
ncbi:uncharacterized protein LOC124354200 isoform X1 [Homalodisca vitripennis]|uniref:uncharacterized protein LOC124354200 isoform X1 n=1 Tax=Homalodisca vitripennis TaxID=197043 RepID=UPI001EEB36D1|nr:uncharacterized protein LOC124354200 isoform X1 [Homalodisca vitripennis]